jgi:hypothetical protein
MSERGDLYVRLTILVQGELPDPLYCLALADLFEEDGKLSEAVKRRRQALVSERMRGLLLDGRVNPSEFFRRYRKCRSSAVKVHKYKGEHTTDTFITIECPSWNMALTSRSLEVDALTLPRWTFTANHGWDRSGEVPPEVLDALEQAALRIETEQAKKQLPLPNKEKT